MNDRDREWILGMVLERAGGGSSAKGLKGLWGSVPTRRLRMVRDGLLVRRGMVRRRGEVLRRVLLRSRRDRRARLRLGQEGRQELRLGRGVHPCDRAGQLSRFRPRVPVAAPARTTCRLLHHLVPVSLFPARQP